MATFSTRIEEIALQLCDLQETIEHHEKLAEEASKEYNKIRMEDLPELMENEGFEIGSVVKLKNGKTLKMKDYFSASIPSDTSIKSQKDAEQREELIDRKTACFNWLVENNLASIIKNEIIVKLKKGENEVAKEIIDEMNERGVECSQEEKVHASTLKATLKEVIESGKQVPFDTFNISSGAIVEIK
jgi:excinuclease UvrABC nuclease subunit